MAMIEKTGRLSQEDNERISQKENCIKNDVSEIDLNCLTIAIKSKWEKSIEKAKEGSWILYTNSNKSERGEVVEAWVLYKDMIQGNAKLEQLATI